MPRGLFRPAGQESPERPCASRRNSRSAGPRSPRRSSIEHPASVASQTPIARAATPALPRTAQRGPGHRHRAAGRRSPTGPAGTPRSPVGEDARRPARNGIDRFDVVQEDVRLQRWWRPRGEDPADNGEHGGQDEEPGEHVGPDQQRLVLPVQEPWGEDQPPPTRRRRRCRPSTADPRGRRRGRSSTDGADGAPAGPHVGRLHRRASADTSGRSRTRHRAHPGVDGGDDHELDGAIQRRAVGGVDGGGAGVEPYTHHGVFASAMSSSMKPRARSGARARLLVLGADGVGVRVAIG